MEKRLAAVFTAGLLTLMIAAGCTGPTSDVMPEQPPSESIANIEPPAAQTPEERIFYGKTELLWQLPKGEYHVVDTTADKSGIAVLYEEVRPRYTGDKNNFRNVMAQFFDVNGRYLRTAETGIARPINSPPTLYALSLQPDRLYFKMDDDIRCGIDRATGSIYKWRYEPLVFDGGASLDYSFEYCEKPIYEGMRFCYSDADGTEYEIAVPEYDDNFGLALEYLITGEDYSDRLGVTYTAKASLIANAKTAVVSNTKLTYEFDFNTLSFTVSRSYTTDMLDEKLDTSPDGTRMLYRADRGGGGDASWSDVVVIEPDGRIVFLCNADMLYGACFFGNDTVLVNTVSDLTAYNLRKPLPVGKDLLNLGWQTLSDGGIRRERIEVGFNIDRKNQLVLVATRPFTQQYADQPVTLTILNAQLETVAVIGTGYKIAAFRDNWIAQCHMTINGDGTVGLNALDEPPVIVDYLAALH